MQLTLDGLTPHRFYTGTRVNDAYLTCLLSWTDLYQQDIRAIPHGQPPATYEKLMEGKAWVPPKPKAAIENDTGGKHRRLLGTERLHMLEDANQDDNDDSDLGEVEDGVEMPHEVMTLDEYLAFYLPDAAPASPLPPHAPASPAQAPAASSHTPTSSPAVGGEERVDGRAVGERVFQAEDYGPGSLREKVVFGEMGALATCYCHRPGKQTMHAYACNRWFSFRDGERLGKLRAKAWILSWDLAKTSIEHRKLRFSGDQISFNFDDPMCADTLDAMAATMDRPLASDILPDDVAVGGDSGGPVAAPRGFQAMMKAKAKARPGKRRGKAKVKAKARPRSCSKSSSAMFSSDSEASSASSASRPSSLMFSTSSASD